MAARLFSPIACLVVAFALCQACNGTAEVDPGGDGPRFEEPWVIEDLSAEELQRREELAGLLEERVGTNDFFYHEFNPYLDKSFRQQYLAHPATDRAARFGPDLLDLQEREELLAAVRHLLTPLEQTAYHQLPNAEACREFLQDRAVRETAPNP